MITALTNAKLVLPEGVVEGALLMENGIILAAGKILPPRDARIIDAGGLYAGPGFVDIHCHGGGSAEGYAEPEQAAAHHLYYGTTSLLISLAYSWTRETWLNGIRKIRQAMQNPETSLAGIHFEGPYTSPKYGASASKAWRINREEYEQLFAEARGLVRQCTYAPELPGARAFARYVRSQGIALAAGHTEMSPAVLQEAVDDGVTIITHLFDAMGCHLGNDSVACTGIIQDTAADAALARSDLFLEMICDSQAIHVKPSNLRLAYRAAGPDKIILITDAVTQVYNPGDYPPDDRHSSPDLNYNEAGELSGSRLTMEHACRNMRKYTGASVPELFQMASRNPALAAGLYASAGSLEAGKPANVVVCDENMVITEVYHQGKAVRR